jgi:hypothetical protein
MKKRGTFVPASENVHLRCDEGEVKSRRAVEMNPLVSSVRAGAPLRQTPLQTQLFDLDADLISVYTSKLWVYVTKTELNQIHRKSQCIFQDFTACAVFRLLPHSASGVLQVG